MQPTTSPISARTATLTRNHARRSHPASRHPASQSQHRTEQLATLQRAGQTPRSRILEAFREMAHGMAAPAAAAQTRSFYRSSGHEWAHSLTEQGSDALRTRVVDAFRSLAHGVQDTAAHAKTLHFYRSGGQSWASRT